MQRSTLIATALLGLTLTGPALALDADTQALERAALCQAMPYREECGGAPPVTKAPAGPKAQTGKTPKGTVPAPVPAPTAEADTTRPMYTPPAQESTKPTRDDFIRAASLLCLSGIHDQDYAALAKSTGATKTALYVACVRAYLAREGITLP